MWRWARTLVHAALISGAVVRRFAYDAYGNHLLAAGSAPASAADAITDLLHSGEATDLTGRQYLRARWYDPTTGRFNRLDPFAGDTNEPQSLHKYLYAHADPIMGVDPTGEALLLDLAFSASASMYMRGASMTATGGFATALVGRLSMAIGQRGMLLTSFMNTVGNQVSNAGTNLFVRGQTLLGQLQVFGRNLPSFWRTPSEPNAQLTHVFNNTRHNLQPLLRLFGGSKETAYRAVELAARSTIQSGTAQVMSRGRGVIEFPVIVQNMSVTVRGTFVNGQFRIGTFFRR